MKKRITLLSILLFAFLSGHSQIASYESVQTKHHKTLNLELFGSHFGTGINFDMRLQRGQNDGLGFRVGIGGFSSSSNLTLAQLLDISILTIPMEVNYIVGKRRHGFIAGIGFITGEVNRLGERPEISGNPIKKEGFSYIGSHALVGYRYSPLNTGLHFQLHYNPVFTEDLGRVEYVGIQIGMGFK